MLPGRVGAFYLLKFGVNSGEGEACCDLSVNTNKPIEPKMHKRMFM
jgi:hypothetical protein